MHSLSFRLPTQGIAVLLLFSFAVFLTSCGGGGEAAAAQEADEETAQEAPSKHDLNLRALVMNKDKYGFINPNGELVIDVKYDVAAPFSEGLACVGKRKGPNGPLHYAFINPDGEVVLDLGRQIRNPSYFREGYAAVYLPNGEGFIDKQGTITGPYRHTRQFHNGRALVTQGEETSYLNKNFEPAFELPNIALGPFHHFNEGVAKIQYLKKPGVGGAWALIDTSGTVLANLDVGPSKVPLASSEGVVWTTKRYGKTFRDVALNTRGEMLFKTDYIYIEAFHEGLAVVQDRESRKYGYINQQGELVIPCKYRLANSFSEGLAAVKQDADPYHWEFINPQGEVVMNLGGGGIPKAFHEGLLAIRTREGWGFMDAERDTVVPPQFEEVHHFVDPNATQYYRSRYEASLNY